MAIVNPITDQAGFDEWVASRPPVIQEMIRLKPPDRLYLMNSGHRCTIYSYAEDRTVTVDVTGEYNCIFFSRHVFGVSIDSLTECDLPAPGEVLGDICQEAGFGEEQVKDIVIPALRKSKPNEG